jgi:hypothetical protein
MYSIIMQFVAVIIVLPVLLTSRGQKKGRIRATSPFEGFSYDQFFGKSAMPRVFPIGSPLERPIFWGVAVWIM